MQKIYLDTGSLLENIKLPIGLHGIVSPISISALGNFWLAIQEKSMVENTALTINYNDKKINYIFSGYLLEDSVVICGNTELTSTSKALEEIMLINNEQANQIRLIEKKTGTILQEIEKQKMNESFLNDFSSLNNELINNKRELIRKNQKIEFLNNELKASNENMSMFTYSVSHDLKEPVRMVKSFLTLLQKKLGDSLDPKGQSYMDFALEGADRLNAMMSDLLEYHQSSNLETSETVDLNRVFMDVQQILQSEITAKKVKINSGKLPVVQGSFTGFRQVFQNLISNAIKFVQEGKTPIISIYSEEKDSDFIITVKDNGIGIDENHMEDVFNLFKRLNPQEQYEGTGMGLAMVKKSIEKMGGVVWLESEKDKGSSFHISVKKP
ncbi:sensor histidine kinase [Algoriphagus sp.]|uniref:sensor histidine kinase n=1 Tax=Algoriphagus sp. TaxID=1872435 RepID=UPI0039189551